MALKQLDSRKLHRIDFLGTRPTDLPVLLSEKGHHTTADVQRAIDATINKLPAHKCLIAIGGCPTPGNVVAILAAWSAGHAVLLHDADPATSGSIISRYAPHVRITPSDGGLAPDVTLASYPSEDKADLHPDLAAVLPTSGSTGSPKAVCLSYANITHNARAIAASLHLAPDDVGLANLPLCYSYGLSILTSHLTAGGRVALSPRSVTDDGLWLFARRTNVTTLSGVPYSYELLHRSGLHHLSLPTLRRATQAGGALAPHLVQEFSDLGTQHGFAFHVMYGQTECTARIAVMPHQHGKVRPGVVGYPIDGTTVTLTPLPGADDDRGELTISGPSVMMGYATSPADLALPPRITSHNTGDIARIEDDGTLRILGRTARFAKVAGRRLDLDHLTTELANDGVTAAIIDTGGSLTAAYEQGSYSPEALANRLATTCHIPISAVTVVATETIPRTSRGKVDRAAIVALGEAKRSEAAHEQRRDGSTTEKIVGAYRFHTRRTKVTADDSFVGLGGDSLAYVGLSTELESIIGHLPKGWETSRIGDLAAAARPKRARRLPRFLSWRTIDASILVRAVAIFLIVATHTEAEKIPGGAHPLLALAGFHVARFVIVPAMSRSQGNYRATLFDMLGTLGRYALRIVAVTWPILLAFYLLFDRYHPRILIYCYRLFSGHDWDDSARFWFVEALLGALLITAVVLLIPGVARLGRRGMLAVWLAVTGVGWLTLYGVIGEGAVHGTDIYLPVVWWLYAAGVALGFAESVFERMVVTYAAIVPVWGLHDDDERSAVIFLGLLIVIWVRHIRLPALIVPPLTAVAAASLMIYVTHWEVMPFFVKDGLLWEAVAASIIVGVVADYVVRKVTGEVTKFRARSHHAVPQQSQGQSPESPRREQLTQ